jgi:hypothetical protein
MRVVGIDPVPLPRCKCGKVCAYYGEVGGFSVKCKGCNAKHAEWQRKNRAKLKRLRGSASGS